MKKIQHKITTCHMPFAYCYIVNWYENKDLAECAVLDYNEMLYFTLLIKQSNDK